MKFIVGQVFVVLFLIDTSRAQGPIYTPGGPTTTGGPGGPTGRPPLGPNGQNASNSTNTTLPTITVPLDEDRMDINHEDVANILFMDVGTWSMQDFYYYNKQNSRVSKKVDHDTDNCFKQYFRCVGNQVYPSFICATNELEQNGANWNTYCEVYLDNCRKRFRFWYVVDVGYCSGYRSNRWFWKVQPTQKRNKGDPWITDYYFPY